MEIIQRYVKQIKNPNCVNCIFVYKKDGKCCLVANLTNGYNIQLTELQNIKSFPYNAIQELSVKANLSENYFDNFAFVKMGGLNLNICLNKTKLIDFSYEKDDSQNGVSVIAHFNDNCSARIIGVKDFVFDKMKNNEFDKILEQTQNNSNNNIEF